MKKIVSIVGARPQFIKAAVVSRAIQEKNAKKSECSLTEVMVHTGQHFDDCMSEVFFRELGIAKPAYNLGICSLSNNQMVARMMEQLEPVLEKEKPELVLVYGDTNSTLAGALAAKKTDISLAHVEAGLRSYNMAMAEEQNRIVTDRLADLLFCPTESSLDNLVQEGIADSRYGQKARFVGDVMYDSALYFANQELEQKWKSQLNLSNGEYILCTLHRAENTDHPDRLMSILQALGRISEEVPVVFPVHPRTHQKLKGWDQCPPGLYLVPPVSYLEMIPLLKEAKWVLTDSGGLQKESYFFKKPCVVLREESEWTELVTLGVNRLAGADTEKILEAVQFFSSWTYPEELPLFYGEGAAGKKISDILFEAC